MGEEVRGLWAGVWCGQRTGRGFTPAPGKRGPRAVRSGVADGSGSEHQGYPADVVEDGLRGREEILEVVRVIGGEGQDFFPGAFIQHELQCPRARVARCSGHPAELVVAELAYFDAVVGDWLLWCRAHVPVLAGCPARAASLPDVFVDLRIAALTRAGGLSTGPTM